MKKYLIEVCRLLLLTIVGVIYAASIALFLDPNNMAPGGISGLAVIINRVVGIETGTLIFAFNIPIIIVGLFKLGFRTIGRTLYVLCITSFAINYLSYQIGAVTNDRTVAALAGGVSMGIGIALCFKFGATTGGADVVVKILRQKYPHLSTGNIFLILDAIIISASAILFKDIEVAVYAAVSVVISSVIMDKILYGTGQGRTLHIVCDNARNISDRVLAEIDAGVTCIKGEGVYTGAEKKVLLCVVRKQKVAKIRKIVGEEDQGAFMFVSPAIDVFGSGYKEYDSEEL